MATLHAVIKIKLWNIYLKLYYMYTEYRSKYIGSKSLLFRGANTTAILFLISCTYRLADRYFLIQRSNWLFELVSAALCNVFSILGTSHVWDMWFAAPLWAFSYIIVTLRYYFVHHLTGDNWHALKNVHHLTGDNWHRVTTQLPLTNKLPLTCHRYLSWLVDSLKSPISR